MNRDMTLLIGYEPDKARESVVSPWKIGQCVMSSAAFTQTPKGVLGAWEAQSNIFVGPLDGKSDARKIARHARQRHPSIAINNAGDTLVAWSENTGWKKGGRLAWQVFTKTPAATAPHGGQAGMPVWSFSAVYALKNGGFEVLY